MTYKRLLLTRAPLYAALLLSLSSCTKKDNTITIGAILPLTGDAAFYGESVKNGIELAAKQINANGGIKGANLVLVFEDSRALPAEGVSAFKKLTSIKWSAVQRVTL